MKTQHALIVLVALFIAVLPSPAFAQIGYHPISMQAVPIDSATVVVDLPSSAIQAKVEHVLWLLPDSTYDIVMELESLEFTGQGGDAVDSTSLHIIFDLLSFEAVDDFVGQGLLDSSGVHSVHVYVHGWGNRLGSGLQTTVQYCSADNYAVRAYSCQYQGNAFVSTLQSSSLSPCGACAMQCENTSVEGVNVH